MTNREVESIKRRLNFTESSRCFFDSLACSITKMVRYNVKSAYQKIPDRFCHIAYDLLESIRLGHIVPSFGNVCATVTDLEPPVEQHPLNRGYWYDSSRHSMVGTVIGTDMITHGGKLYITELNTNSGLRPQRRKLYKSRIDPLVSGLVSFARRLKFKKLIVINAGWEPLYQRVPDMKKLAALIDSKRGIYRK